MKTVIRLFAVAVLAMAFTSSTLAGDCCTKAAAAAKGEAKSCEKCAPKK